MPSSANTRSNSEKGSSYRPDYDVWNEETGTPTHHDNGDNYTGASDNGSGYYGKDNGQDSGSTGSPTSRDTAINSLRQAENGAISKKEPSYYTGNGRKSDNANLGKKKGKGKKKGIGALITILLVLGGGMAFLGSSNSLLAPALSALTTSATQTNYTSYILRTRFITSRMLSGNTAGAVTTGWNGQLKYTKVPTYLKNRLAKNGIEVSGNSLIWNGESISASRFPEFYNNNVEFREAYTKAKRGRVATFFDNAANKLYQKLGLSRNWRANLRDTGNAESDMRNLDDTLSSRFDPNGKTNVRTNAEYQKKDIEYEDEIIDGKKTGKKIPVEVINDVTDPTSANSSSSGGADMETAKGSAKSFISNVAGTVASLGSAACTLMKVGNMIAITVAANEIYQSINYFMGQLEGPSKMMAGYGMESGINSQLNKLSTPAASSVTDFNKIGTVNMSEGANNYGDGNPPETDPETAAPIEAPLLLTMLSGAPASASDASNYSLERTIKAMGGAAMFTTSAVGICAGVNIVNNIISISSIFAGGIPSFIGSVIVKAGLAAVTSIAMSAVLGFMIPTIARALFTNIYDNATGVVAGNLIAQGAYAANSRNGRSGSGQSPSDEKAIRAFNRDTNTVLAMEAEQDRLTHSPFDITNRNTFFGSIAYSLLPTITSSSTTGLASFLRSTSKSLSSLVSHVSAQGDGSSYMTTYGDCPMLNEIGVKGDLFCNPIVTTDMSTIDLEPDNTEYAKVIGESMEDCDADGNCNIRTDSNLAYYISYCDNRDSPFGVVDQNILGAMQGDVANNVVLNSIPLIGDIIDIVNNANDLKNMDWATGARCSNTSQNNHWDNEMKYYQRYVEDQRILDQMGAYEGSKNPVLAYEEWYDNEHPTDDTYVGYLSRISGLTPENTETILAFAIYQNFIDNYDPTSRIAMTGNTSDIQNGEQASATIANNITFCDNTDYIHNPIETNATKHEHIVYYDLRNRSYVA